MAHEEITDEELFSYIRYRFLSEKCLYDSFVASVDSALNEVRNDKSIHNTAEYIVNRILDK